MSLVLIEGPAGAGKSAVTALMLEAGEVQVVADATEIWAAISGAQRGPDGRYPVRRDDDAALRTAQYLKNVAVRHALEQGRDVAVTTSVRGQAEKYRRMAIENGTDLIVRTVDPGRETVTARLSEPDGSLSDDCMQAIRRWYG